MLMIFGQQFQIRTYFATLFTIFVRVHTVSVSQWHLYFGGVPIEESTSSQVSKFKVVYKMKKKTSDQGSLFTGVKRHV